MTTETIGELHDDLEAAALAIEDAAYDLFIVSTKKSHEIPKETLELIRNLHNHADRLRGYMDEVKSGKIVRR
ncbi:hypothetical protein [Pseudomonas asplenii]|uniref:Uncharacterized protein n=1 Tax=Pseudomonas asplenii TaxID=53407 RepID=A0A0M9GBU7_9PSED|nr:MULTISPECIES: hypothetical protein [Pseudomonas]KPA87092.1 hypothetical protein PF66_06437 [Pseudomonas fuscovaginae]